ncbi:mg586 protein [Tupanvirus deep ocean]|uniref:Mg586 protein n=2 Tax=Tupanvirus TaxID=2094720 RepID=A0AC62A9U6_9VIRU|nr:mg586 protein [Tupanvirus deep ocean]QKU34425.1 mg586 protein [Tupanvirus deep ocean]
MSLGFEIKSEADIKGIPGIGKGTLVRIKEILETGKLSELQSFGDNKELSKINNIQELLKVIGVGDRLARKLVIELGVTTVGQLRDVVAKGKVRVSRQVVLGLKYHDILERNIPRKEIQQIEKYLIKKAAEIDPNLHVMICGSYRRGRLVSGDIDAMLYHPNVKFVLRFYL